MNNKAWIKIAEAFLAVVIIAAVILTVYSRQSSYSPKEQVSVLQDSILSEISGNKALRQDILDRKIENINSFIQQRIPSDMNFTAKICGIDDVCAFDVYKKEVYARERIISSTLAEYSPKKLKLFIWEK